MLVTWLGHAQLFINAAGKTFLLDPWFHEPVFGGAWFRYPPPPYPDSSSLPRPDFLLLSHIHPDHSGQKTLEQLPKDIPTYATPFPSNALKRRLDRVGYRKVTWLEAWQTQEIGPGIKLTFVPHDRGWEVSSVVLEADGVRLYHGNDNPLSLAGYQQIVERLGPIDLAFLPFAGASSYPTCFEGSRELLDQRCAQKKAEGIKRFLEGLEGLKPQEAAPFASSWALLEPTELWKNFVDRPTPVEALKAAMPKAAELGTHLLHMEPGDQWSPETGAIAKHLTEGWDYTANDVRRYAALHTDRVRAAIADDRHVGKSVAFEKLDTVFREYMGEMLARSKPVLDMNAGFESKGQGGWRIEFRTGAAPQIVAGLKGDEDETLTLHPGELWGLLTGPANWEDVWYGYRLHVRKREGAGYYRPFWEMLLNFDAEELSARLHEKHGA